ncbi:hypothetical protein EZJ43_04410 [Pedobacter changchengzhani]|uniref:Uncharacterized protein n=1 Tax=Pedobacter changchengzhani TaxID=2529274 RepID=A0A4R5MP32_9SPHI|nr:hypothetical protein [Pedobacter changchengzhani]TDG37366.1 hypothetical protein EZJ43_04410 [Pedobacter changchengzhani]
MDNIEVRYYLNKQIKVTCSIFEARNSLWVYSPKIENLAKNIILLDLIGTPWDNCGTEETENGIQIKLRKFPGTIYGVVVKFDINDVNTCYLNGVLIPLNHLKTAIDDIKETPSSK